MRIKGLIFFTTLVACWLVPPESGANEPHSFPGDSQGGYGFFGMFIPLNRGVCPPEKWKGEITGGFGLFGEYLPIPWLALGLEASLAFPKVERTSGGEVAGKCTTCRRDIMLAVDARIKVPIRVQKTTSFYPLALLGYSMYRHDTKERTTAFHGLGVGGGLGVEVYSEATAVALEIRYMLHHTPGTSNSGELSDHNLVILLALRLL